MFCSIFELTNDVLRKRSIQQVNNVLIEARSLIEAGSLFLAEGFGALF